MNFSLFQYLIVVYFNAPLIYSILLKKKNAMYKQVHVTHVLYIFEKYHINENFALYTIIIIDQSSRLAIIDFFFLIIIFH